MLKKCHVNAMRVIADECSGRRQALSNLHSQKYMRIVEKGEAPRPKSHVRRL